MDAIVEEMEAVKNLERKTVRGEGLRDARKREPFPVERGSCVIPSEGITSVSGSRLSVA